MKLPIELHKKQHPGDIRKATVIAFVLSRGSIVSVGYNRRRELAVDGRMSQHAEEAALKKAGRRAVGATLYVVRFKKDGSKGLSQPCTRCYDTLNRAGIVKVFFSLDDENVWGRLIWKNGEWIRYSAVG